MVRNKQGRLVDIEMDEYQTTTKTDEIIKMFKEQVFTPIVGGAHDAHRATKIICTIGE